ncbi:hypothetical protein K502DRAFT_326636 [Neoconidiobolus thromboides FSU 785]|nr:hypothetical protein K502DRAFT_326636 [Neoconidiobolus thromboides FSU 785]
MIAKNSGELDLNLSRNSDNNYSNENSQITPNKNKGSDQEIIIIGDADSITERISFENSDSFLTRGIKRIKSTWSEIITISSNSDSEGFGESEATLNYRLNKSIKKFDGKVYTVPIIINGRVELKKINIRDDIFQLLPTEIRIKFENPSHYFIESDQDKDLSRVKQLKDEIANYDNRDRDLLLKLAKYINIFKLQPHLENLCYTFLNSYLSNKDYAYLFNFVYFLSAFNNLIILPSLTLDSKYEIHRLKDVGQPKILVKSTSRRYKLNDPLKIKYKVDDKIIRKNGEIIYKLINYKTWKYEKKKITELDDCLKEVEKFEHQKMEQSLCYYTI